MQFNLTHALVAVVMVTLAVIGSVFLSGSSFAQHKHGATGPNGGLMEDVAGIHAELVAKGTDIVV